jgi:RNA polymerase sigma-70 factor (ECF subfamily)
MDRDDKEIKTIELAKKGDRKAQSEIVRKNEQMVFNVALKLLSDPQEAECVLQETFLKVFTSLDKFRGESGLSTWIYRIATNFALMRLRSRKKGVVSLYDKENISSDYIEAFNKSLGRDPLHKIMDTELKSAMDEAIEQLPPKFKSTFVLKDIEGLSLKEVGEILDMSLPALS